jgi:hypothetical protein
MTDEDKSVVDKAKGVTGTVVEKTKPLVDKAGDVTVSALDKAKDVTGSVVEKTKPLVDKAGDVAGSLLDKAKEKLATEKPAGSATTDAGDETDA